MTVPPIDAARRQPVFNLPPVIIVLAVGLAAIHAVRVYLLTDLQEEWVLLNFAFIPARLDDFAGVALPVDVLPGAAVWTFVTYAFLHGDIVHLLVNIVWLAAFGSPLAWRLGAVRFLLFSGIAAAAGAGVHLLFHGGELVPVVGASAAISAHMAGASRFLFLGQGPGLRSYYAPAAPLAAVFTDRRTVTFLAIWFGTNIVFGLTGVGAGQAAGVAWEAHIGGFLAGLLLFSFLDPVGKGRMPPIEPGDRAA
jgi:membrane associated rhomboid family serine protease